MIPAWPVISTHFSITQPDSRFRCQPGHDQQASSASWSLSFWSVKWKCQYLPPKRMEVIEASGTQQVMARNGSWKHIANQGKASCYLLLLSSFIGAFIDSRSQSYIFTKYLPPSRNCAVCWGSALLLIRSFSQDGSSPPSNRIPDSNSLAKWIPCPQNGKFGGRDGKAYLGPLHTCLPQAPSVFLFHQLWGRLFIFVVT